MESPLGSDLARLVRVWRALIDHRLKPLELTQTHWVTLHNIHQLPPEQSQIQLAKAIGIEQPSLVRTLDQLEEKGLISRQTCANDRRAKRIRLTEKAEPLINEMEEVIGKTRDEILSGVSAEEVATEISENSSILPIHNPTKIIARGKESRRQGTTTVVSAPGRFVSSATFNGINAISIPEVGTPAKRTPFVKRT